MESPWVAGVRVSKNSSTVLQEVWSICGQLLGEPLARSGTFRAPTVPDESIQDVLRSWRSGVRGLVSTSQPLKSMVRRKRVERSVLFSEDVSRAVDAMDAIVSLLSEKAQGWIRVMLALHIIRLVWQGLFFYGCLTIMLTCIWIPFVKTFNELQSLRQQQHSLLRADFDAVIETSLSSPFEVLCSCKAFDDMVGKPMLGESILDCAANVAEKKNLSDFLEAGVSHGVQPQAVNEQHRFCFAGVWRSLCSSSCIWTWPVNEVAANLGESFVAPKINSRWDCDVEICFVGKGDQSAGGNSSLLAVRQLGETVREQNDMLVSSPTTHPPMDFHSWTKALQKQNDAAIDITPKDDLPEIVGDTALDQICHKLNYSGRSSSSSSSFFPRRKVYYKRRLMNLDMLEMALVEGSEIDGYKLCFLDDGLEHDGQTSSVRPDFCQCVVGDDRDAFILWLQECTNQMLSSESSGPFDYDGEVQFRPPAATCTSSKIVLCAESARIEPEVPGTAAIRSLQLYNVSQLIEYQGSHMTTAMQKLPVVYESHTHSSL